MGERAQRLVFGEDAERYEAHRPSYPVALVDDLVSWAGSQHRALEVGAGTGKATRLLTARGVSVVAVEPSAEMAAVARRAVCGPGEVEFVISDFERADLGQRRFPLLYAGQAWHWVDSATGYTAARRALVEGGYLAVFWNRPNWPDSPLRAALDEVYDRIVPDLRGGPLRPRGERGAEVRTDWEREIGGVEGFAHPEVRRYDWSLHHTADEYVELAATHSDIRLLDDEPRRALLQGLRVAIESHGGSFDLPMYVRACVARAA